MTINVNYTMYNEERIEIDNKYDSVLMSDEDFFNMTDKQRKEWRILLNEMLEEIKRKTGADHVNGIYNDKGFSAYED